MLDVDERVILPEITHVRFIITSGDVIHSYACPALGIKADAYPGRLNQASTLINREGTFYGQCSVINPLTNSDSASARSNGALLVSATDPMKKIKNIGNKGNINHTAFCASIFIVKFKLFVKKTTNSTAELNINS